VDWLVAAEVGDGVHLHVVTDGEAVEAGDVAEDVRRYAAAERRWKIGFIEPRIRSMADHDGARFAAEARERHEIAARELLERDVDDRGAVMRIGRAGADAGKMFDARGDARAVQAAHERAGELDDGVDVAAERAALEALRRFGAAHVDHRREIDLDVKPAQRHPNYAPAPRRHLRRALPLRECLGAGQSGNDVAEPIDAAALLIDHEERW